MTMNKPLEGEIIDEETTRNPEVIRKELDIVLEKFIISGYKNYGYPKMSRSKFIHDIMITTSGVGCEIAHLLVWKPEMEGYQQLYNSDIPNNLEVFVFANFFQLLAGVSVIILIPRLRYYKLYFQGKKLWEELAESIRTRTDLSDKKISHQKPSITDRTDIDIPL